MTPLLAILEWGDFAIIACIVIMFAGGAAYSVGRDNRVLQLQRQLHEVQQKLDALLKHQGIVISRPEPFDLSPELQILAREPSQKIAAIKRYREENPGTGLADAKVRIEEFAKNGR